MKCSINYKNNSNIFDFLTNNLLIYLSKIYKKKEFILNNEVEYKNNGFEIQKIASVFKILGFVTKVAGLIFEKSGFGTNKSDVGIKNLGFKTTILGV